jgi:hypothetical protein
MNKIYLLVIVTLYSCSNSQEKSVNKVSDFETYYHTEQKRLDSIVDSRVKTDKVNITDTNNPIYIESDFVGTWESYDEKKDPVDDMLILYIDGTGLWNESSLSTGESSNPITWDLNKNFSIIVKWVDPNIPSNLSTFPFVIKQIGDSIMLDDRLHSGDDHHLRLLHKKS